MPFFSILGDDGTKNLFTMQQQHPPPPSVFFLDATASIIHRRTRSLVVTALPKSPLSTALIFELRSRDFHTSELHCVPGITHLFTHLFSRSVHRQPLLVCTVFQRIWFGWGWRIRVIVDLNSLYGGICGGGVIYFLKSVLNSSWDTCSLLALTDGDVMERLEIFSFQCDKENSLLHISSLSLPPPPSHPCSSVLQNPPERPSSFFLSSPHLIPSLHCCVLAFQVPHSSARHTNLPVGPPEELLACDYPLVFRADKHTHENRENERDNKFIDWWFHSFITSEEPFMVS